MTVDSKHHGFVTTTQRRRRWSRCHTERASLSSRSSVYLPEADRRGVQPSDSQSSAPSPKRNVEEPRLPPMCCPHSRERSCAAEAALLGAMPTYNRPSGSDGCGIAGIPGTASGTAHHAYKPGSPGAPVVASVSAMVWTGGRRSAAAISAGLGELHGVDMSLPATTCSVDQVLDNHPVPRRP